jgi:acyl-CoA oxidase
MATKQSDEAVILPFAPLLYLIWSDGALSAEEIDAVRGRIQADAGLDAATRAALDRWLDPERPPTPVALNRLLETIRSSAETVGPDARRSLLELGHELGRAYGAPTPAGEAALRALEQALGAPGGEAARALLPAEEAPHELEPARPFDPAALEKVLDPTHRELRARVLRLVQQPEFALGYEEDGVAYRARVHAWCRRLADEGLGGIGYPREFGGEHDATQAITVFETLAFHDLSLLVKFGVHFGLFGGSIYQLGTRRHHEKYLRAIATLELPGCFAMTETAHGSNVRDIETIAVFDVETREFVIHTPHEQAGKDYIGNAAVYGQVATVFAQLEVRGERHGVHAFVVPIRDAVGRILPGVRIADRGAKEGLNGVDNGRIWFDHVRIPRENLLNRFGDVSASGVYTSPIASAGRRFFTMLGTLIAGRISIAAAAVNSAKLGLAIAVRYTDRRRQFGPEGRPELPVLDYLTMQRRLLPRLAASYAADIAMNDLVQRFGAHAADAAQELEAHAAGLKAWASKLAVETIQECREACGGEGYMAINRLPALRADADIFTTFEGANTVLLQLVAKGLLTEYRQQFGELRLWSAVRYMGGRAAAAIADLNPIAPRRTDEEHLRDPAFHVAAFRYREDRLLATLGRRLRRRIESGEDSFSALNACQDHAVALAHAHVERIVLERFRDAITAADTGVRAALEPLATLFALSRLEADAGWFLEKGYFEAGKSRAIRALVNQLCGEIRPAAVAYVDAFGIPDALLPPIAR